MRASESRLKSLFITYTEKLAMNDIFVNIVVVHSDMQRLSYKVKKVLVV